MVGTGLPIGDEYLCERTVVCHRTHERTMRRLDHSPYATGSRAVTGNMFWTQIEQSINATEILDVQGFSHQSASVFASFHARFPEKPAAATECCSCETQVRFRVTSRCETFALCFT